MSNSRNETARKSKRRIEYRLRDIDWDPQPDPMFSASNIYYEMADRVKAIAHGGIGAIHKLSQASGLIEMIDKSLHLLKVHLPYHESDHVLNIAYNILAGGTCLEDIELLRNDENYLNALGAQRIPDPTTAGDFCRRFKVEDVITLMTVINEARLQVWQEQPEKFFTEAILDVDGTIAETSGECKDGMDISYDGKWGYHPLLVSLANTGEPLFLCNRSGNRPSHDEAPVWIDRAIELCKRAGFKTITLRGDTDFSLTRHFDRWDEREVRFVFGYDAKANLIELAEKLPKGDWERLERPPKYTTKTSPRARPKNVKDEIIREREFKNIRLRSEEVADFPYSPTQCKKTYRMVVVRKNLSVEQGENHLIDDIRYFFYITNDWIGTSAFIVFDANSRCDQENLIAQLHGGVHALRMPVDNLVSNWAYMVMASLAWTLKSWFALLLPENGRWKERRKKEKQKVLGMEFRTFQNAFMQIPTQIIRQGRKIIFRVLGWNRWLSVFFRGSDRIRGWTPC